MEGNKNKLNLQRRKQRKNARKSTRDTFDERSMYMYM